VAVPAADREVRVDVRIEESWKRVLGSEFEKAYFANLTDFVRTAYATGTCYPPAKLIFNAFNRTPFDKVKVVILGQDPYHEPGQAQGLCFYVPPDIQTPPSLVNIAKELAMGKVEGGMLKVEQRNLTSDSAGQHIENGVVCCSTSNLQPPTSFPVPDLLSWTDQGVLLLNATLTVAAHKAGSHQGHGWETFTDAVVRVLAEQREHLVFILWGSYAQKKGAFIDRNRHCVIASAHPSPLSAYRGFFGSQPFAKANEYLREKGIGEIAW